MPDLWEQRGGKTFLSTYTLLVPRLKWRNSECGWKEIGPITQPFVFIQEAWAGMAAATQSHE